MILQSSSLLAQSVRRIASSAAKNNKIQHSPVDPKFRALQEKFQVNYLDLDLLQVLILPEF